MGDNAINGLHYDHYDDENDLRLDGDSKLEELIEDNFHIGQVERIEAAELRSISDEALSTLTPREENILRMRFGLDRGGSEWICTKLQRPNFPTMQTA